MSSGSHSRDRINRARKAGLSLRDLYSALSTLPADTAGQEVDGNGYVATSDEQGRREYRPHTDSPSSDEIPVPLATAEEEPPATGE